MTSIMDINNNPNARFNTIFTQEQRDDTAVLRIAGDLDAMSEEHFEQYLPLVLHNPDTAVLEIDLTDVNFIDSRGLRQLIMAKISAEESEKRLVIRNAAYSILRIMDITGLGDQFEFNPPRTPED